MRDERRRQAIPGVKGDRSDRRREWTEEDDNVDDLVGQWFLGEGTVVARGRSAPLFFLLRVMPTGPARAADATAVKALYL